ncbi:MAG TPA: DUF2798 domain-containing protein [Candidatus Blautia intestinavium]|nr:DUF2798 domain-containing protein [Candidatus Blautia intestinavium]
MPKTKFQEIIFTILMVIVMVYAMICYNISLETGGLSSGVFAAAFHELLIMGPAAFLLDFFLVGKITQRTALRLVNPERENPFHLVLAISALSVAWMCPLMSFLATILFKHAGAAFLPVWLQTTALNFPMAFFWQIFYAGPFVRFIFRHIFSSSSNQIPETQKEV